MPRLAPQGRPMLPAGTFAGQTVLVTGGGTGLGKAIAVEFARLGAAVAIASRSEEHRAAGIAAVEAVGAKAIGGRARRPRARLDRCGVRRRRGRPRAGHGPGQQRGGELPGRGRRSVTQRLACGRADRPGRHVLLLAGAAPPHAVATGAEARILNIVSTAASTGGPGMVHSAAAKAGVGDLTKTLAVEWAPDGIRRQRASRPDCSRTTTCRRRSAQSAMSRWMRLGSPPAESAIRTSSAGQRRTSARRSPRSSLDTSSSWTAATGCAATSPCRRSARSRSRWAHDHWDLCRHCRPPGVPETRLPVRVPRAPAGLGRPRAVDDHVRCHLVDALQSMTRRLSRCPSRSGRRSSRSWPGRWSVTPTPRSARTPRSPRRWCPDGGDGYGHIPFIVVDSLASIVGGRANWLLPKALARFDWLSTDSAAGSEGSVTIVGEQPAKPAWSITVQFSTSGEASPLSLENHVQQVTNDGDVHRFDGEMTGQLTGHPSRYPATPTAHSLRSCTRAGTTPPH